MKLFCLRIDLDRFQQVVVSGDRYQTQSVSCINDDDKLKLGLHTIFLAAEKKPLASFRDRNLYFVRRMLHTIQQTHPKVNYVRSNSKVARYNAFVYKLQVLLLDVNSLFYS
jgi:hypothetical protein